MIVGFSRHGTGSGRGPTEYLTDEKRVGRENAPPQVLRGDKDNTRKLIDSLDFKHKYTSGVLSFAPNEQITPKMEQAIMDRFESVAFAGLEPDQYNILWVRHTHAGHHELHFVTPRVELSSGKSLNIKPPGERAREHFDDFRSEINARYGLADPTDPHRAKNVSTPDHELKIASEALRSGQRPPDNMRELIDGVLSQRAVHGLIRSREDVLENIKDLDLNVTRAGKNYITVSEPQSGQRWRLKGALYERDFEPSRTIERSDAGRERDYSRPDPETAKRYEDRVDRHIRARAGYNQERYPRKKPELKLVHSHEQVAIANVGRVQSLSGFLRRELGDNAILHGSGINSTSERDGAGEVGRESGVIEMREGGEALRSSPTKVGDVREQRRKVHDSEGVLTDDRARDPIIGSVREAGRSAERIANACSNATDTDRSISQLGRKLQSFNRKIDDVIQSCRTVIERISEQVRQQRQERSRDNDRGMSL